jgi:preprotein translocase SecE subunit
MIGVGMAIEERPSTKGVTSVGTGQPPEQNLKVARNTLQETIVELKKTTWPTRAEANRLTAVVIGVILVLALYMGLLDAALSSLDRIFQLT